MIYCEYPTLTYTGNLETIRILRSRYGITSVSENKVAHTKFIPEHPDIRHFICEMYNIDPVSTEFVYTPDDLSDTPL